MTSATWFTSAGSALNVRDILKAARRGHVVVSGPSGSGRSTAVEEIALRVARGSDPPLVMHASAAWTRQAWGALAQADPQWAREVHFVVGDLAKAGAAAIGVAAQRLAEAPLIIVDDGELLDDDTAALLARTDTPAVVALNTERRWSPAVRALAESATAFHLPTLSPEGVMDAVEHAWGATLDRLGAHRIHAASGGRPGYVRRLLDALVDAAHITDTRVRIPGALGTCGDLPTWAAERLHAMGSEQARVLRVVAMYPFVTAEVLAATVSAAATDRLVRSGELMRAKGPSGDWMVADPLLRTVVTDALGPAHSTDDARALLRAAGGTASPAATARWQVAAGLDPTPEGLALALADSLDEGDLRGARVLARAAAHLDSPMLLGLCAEHLAASGDVDKAIEVGRRASESAVPEAAGRGRLVAADLLFFRRGQPSDALEVLGASAAVDAQSAVEVHALANLIASIVGQPTPHLDTAPANPAIPSRGQPPYAALLAELMAILSGRADPEASPLLLASATPPLLRPRARINAVLHAAAAGDLARADQIARQGVSAALETGRAGAVGLAVSMHADVKALQGRLEDAASGFDEALWLLEQDDESGVLAVTQAARAGLAAEAGHLESAEAMLSGLPDRGDLRVSLRAASARVRIAAVQDPARAESLMLDALAQGDAGGNVYWAALAGLHGLRAGVRGAVPMAIDQLVEGTSGDLLPAIGAFARACAADDADALAAAGDAFAGCGAGRVAAEAWLSAWSAGADAVSRTQLRTRAAAALATLGPPHLVSSAEELTARERQVAQLAAGGASSAHIAERLSISVRTVDNHLLAVYRKTGVEGRAGLSEVLLMG